MKRILIGFTLLLVAFGLTACSDDNGGNDVDTTSDVVSILEDAGYELTNHDADARTYFADNTLGGLGLDLDVTSLYIGYLDGGNWVQVIGLNTADDATEVYNAFIADNKDGQLIYQDGNTIMLTYTQTTRDLFE